MNCIMSSLLLLNLLLQTILLTTKGYNITCAPSNDCTGTNIVCQTNANDRNCNVKCLGYESCQGAINCGSQQNSVCTIDCSAYNACEDVQVFCPPNSECNINCIADEAACEGIIINSNVNTITNINCAGEEACIASTINCKSSAECNIHCHGNTACGIDPKKSGVPPMTIYGENTQKLSLTGCDGGQQTTPTCNSINLHCPPYQIDSTNTKTPRCFLPGMN